MSMQRGLQFFARFETVALQDFFDPSIESLDHSIGLRGFWRAQTVLDVQVDAGPVELMLAGRRSLAQTEEAIGELLPVIGQDCADTDRASSFKVTQNRRALAAVLLL